MTNFFPVSMQSDLVFVESGCKWTQLDIDGHCQILFSYLVWHV